MGGLCIFCLTEPAEDKKPFSESAVHKKRASLVLPFSFPSHLLPAVRGELFRKRVTLETSGGGLSQGEEDVTHDGGTADSRGGDDIEDAVYVLEEVLLRRGGRSEGSHATD